MDSSDYAPSGDESYVDNSQESHSDSSEAPVKESQELNGTNLFLLLHHVHIKLITCNKTETAVHDVATTKSKQKTKNKTKNRQKCSKYARNTSYGSKVGCADMHEIKDFLSSTRCACKNNCLYKLSLLPNGKGCETVMRIRQQRFACTSVVHQTWQAKSPASFHPG